MGYVAVTGGQDAIDASIELLKEYRSGGKLPVDTEILRDRMKLLIDRVMSEAGLYAPDYAALASNNAKEARKKPYSCCAPTAAPCPGIIPRAPCMGMKCTSGGESALPSRIFPAGRCSAPPTITYTAC